MLQNILTWTYVFLGLAAFVYWIVALVSIFGMLKYRKQGQSLLKVATIGMVNEDNFQEEGKYQRDKCFQSIRRFVYCIGGMVLVVYIGIQTQ